MDEGRFYTEKETPSLKIRVLGSYGSDLALDHQRPQTTCQSVGFLVNDHILVDAGTAATALTFDEQLGLEHVLLSHLHFDHIKGLPSLVDNLVGEADHPLKISAISPVLRGLRQHIFNNLIFPDFYAPMSIGKQAILTESEVFEGKEADLGSVQCLPIRVNHIVPTVGFIIRNDESAFLYSGDTYCTEAIWNIARMTPNLKAAFIETSFPNELGSLAKDSKHLTPSLLVKEFQKIGKPDLPLYLYHLKPIYRQKIIQELQALHLPNLHVLEDGQEIIL
jgi:ribonuclease BN (tRNA processing enzyme)